MPACVQRARILSQIGCYRKGKELFLCGQVVYTCICLNMYCANVVITCRAKKIRDNYFLLRYGAYMGVVIPYGSLACFVIQR